MNDTGFADVKGDGSGSGKKFAKRIKMKQGSNIVRIIPPIKSLAEAGVWFKFYRQHFGYNVLNSSTKPGQAPSFPAPFECMEERNRQDMIVVACPECQLIEEKKELLASREAESQGKGLDKATLEAFLKPFKIWVKNHNIDKKYYINVKTMTGEFGFLPVPYKAYKALRAEMARVEASEGINSINASEGCYFDIVRTGEGLTTEYTVHVVTEPVDFNGRKLQCVKRAPLTKQDYEQALNDCADLTVDPIRHLTMEQVTAIVSMERESGADPEAVQHILNLGTKRGRGEASKEVSREASAAPAPVAKVEAPKPPPPPVVSEEEDEEAKLLAALDAARKAKAARQKNVEAVQAEAEKVVAAAGKFGSTTKAAMSDEDFLAIFPDPTKK